MDRSRFDLQVDAFRRALAALRESIETDDGDKKSRDSILLSFVFTFDAACKAMRLALALEGIDVPDYAAPILRAAFQARLFADAAQWESMRAGRNGVAHAYDEEKAIEIAALVRRDALALFSVLLTNLQAR